MKTNYSVWPRRTTKLLLTLSTATLLAAVRSSFVFQILGDKNKEAQIVLLRVEWPEMGVVEYRRVTAGMGIPDSFLGIAA